MDIGRGREIESGDNCFHIAIFTSTSPFLFPYLSLPLSLFFVQYAFYLLKWKVEEESLNPTRFKGRKKGCSNRKEKDKNKERDITRGERESLDKNRSSKESRDSRV